MKLIASKNLTVKAIHGYHVTKIKMKKKWRLRQGQSYRLKIKILPKEASHRVSWTSSNSRWVSVSQRGVLKAKRAGKRVVITVRAKDGGGKKARCVIRTIR